MKYTVVWGRDAERDLAAIWTDAVQRREISSAADTLDLLLREDAHLAGESRSGRSRVLLVPPLGIDFEVLPEDRLARVLAVWIVKKQGFP